MSDQAKFVEIKNEKFNQVQELKASGLPEWVAVAKVLGISEDSDFVVNTLGTSSKPQDGLLVIFPDRG